MCRNSDDTEHFRRLYHYSLMFSMLLAAGLIGTIIRLRAVRQAEEKKKQKPLPKRCTSSEKEMMIMAEIRRRVIEQKDYLRPGLTLTSLSDKLGVNRVYISRAVNRNTGRHFCRWLNEIRITEAIARLSDPDCTCNFSEIAYDVGFNDRTTFFRAFKQITRSSPRDFCRSIEKKCCNS